MLVLFVDNVTACRKYQSADNNACTGIFNGFKLLFMILCEC